MRWIARSVVPFARICAFDFARVDMLGLGAWSDDLVVLLVEFLQDDTKLAQPCTDWLYVQHWYTVVPDPAMRVTLWALVGAGGNCHEHMQDTLPTFLLFKKCLPWTASSASALPHMLCALSRYLIVFWRSFWIRSLLRQFDGFRIVGVASWRRALFNSHTRYIHRVLPSLCCQIGPVFSVPLRHQTSSHRRHGLGILHRGMTAGYVMLTNTFYRAFCSCKCRIRPCICPLHAWWISRMTNFECLSCLLALPCGSVEMTNLECVLCSCSSAQLPMSFFVRHESKQMAPEWVEAPLSTPSSC